MKNKLFKDIKQNKYTSIAIVAFVVLLVLLFVVYKALMPSLGTPVYGDRLDGIDEYEIAEGEFDNLDSTVSANAYVVSSNSSLSGKTVNVVVTVKEDTKTSTAKKITSIVMDEFSEEQIKYYDFQVFIKNENDEKKGYPIIGYKNKSNTTFSFSSSK